MSKDKIEVGDKVSVFFQQGMALFEYEVLSIPCATGDCWHLKKDRDLQYVQQFESMQLQPREQV